jgi:hypothetical protein
MDPDITEFVAVHDIGERLNLHPNALRRRLKVAQIPVFRDPFDHRRRLVRVEDAAELMRPQPTSVRPLASNQGGSAAILG